MQLIVFRWPYDTETRSYPCPAGVTAWLKPKVFSKRSCRECLRKSYWLRFTLVCAHFAGLEEKWRRALHPCSNFMTSTLNKLSFSTQVKSTLWQCLYIDQWVRKLVIKLFLASIISWMLFLIRRNSFSAFFKYIMNYDSVLRCSTVGCWNYWYELNVYPNNVL